ncbi:ABC transporter ATP-binding protein [Aquabacterium sp. OR-4]|uniref:ABC transporter ATP-binding protein n=1 Tax=Aquabacterium sp. OR-4 TaxID=2978127 RepID=UPI0021B40922|nr:ABC transporter ATP-binding protein [Aquabacterium sp. OR-4]MDT7838077.1 ABC transporter ATP-binding protein [Aquabacterium sp. OR-4]
MSDTPAAIGLSVQGLTVRYGAFTALSEVGFTLAPGEALGLVGGSGSGKSTVLRAICGLAPRSAGQVQLQADGPAGAALPAPGSLAFRRCVQMVFQDPFGSLHPRQTVDRQLAEPLAIHRVPDAEARIARALDEVGLGEASGGGFRFRYPHQLSGGQRQRVAIARALILEPRVLLLDEPTSALDASVQAEVLNLLDSLRQRRGLSYLMVSHDLAVVTHLCQRLLVMERGRIVEQLTAQDLAARRVSAPATQALLAAAQGFVRKPAAAEEQGA